MEGESQGKPAKRFTWKEKPLNQHVCVCDDDDDNSKCHKETAI